MQTEATGQRLVEAAAINKSLTALGQVFTALACNALHVPYRNSKLTHVVQDCLGGDAKTMVFIHVSPLESNRAETISTLTFGRVSARARLSSRLWCGLICARASVPVRRRALACLTVCALLFRRAEHSTGPARPGNAPLTRSALPVEDSTSCVVYHIIPWEDPS